MAWRLEDSVARGEIDNRTRGSVEGKVWLAGRSDPLVLRLTGNCHGDLAGCLLVFSNPAPKPDSSLALASDQRGVAGDITASHPLVADLLERSTRLMKLAEDAHDKDLEQMVSGFMIVGPKVAGALGSLISGWDKELNGLAVAKLKRAMGELSRALNAASRLKQRNVELPFSIDEWVAEMLKVREELLILMDKFRGKGD